MTETEQAKAFWRDADVTPCYKKPTLQSAAIVRAVEELNKVSPIKSVFEFGCGTGRTLAMIRHDMPEIALRGIDINEKMLEAGRHFKLDISLGDENDIPVEPTFDLVFTCSVLDHLPDPAPVLNCLIEASKHLVVILEPYNGQSGSAENVARQPFSYWWDYDRMLRGAGLKVILKRHLCLATSGFGPYYFLWECCRW